MTTARNRDYSRICRDIFSLSSEELHGQIEITGLSSNFADKIYSSNITFAEYEFILLCELGFRQEFGRHNSCQICNLELNS